MKMVKLFEAEIRLIQKFRELDKRGIEAVFLTLYSQHRHVKEHNITSMMDEVQANKPKLRLIK